MPWVRLHGTKDYLDMVKILEKYPEIHLTFNLVPCLIEQIEDYANRTVKDKYLELSYKPSQELTNQDKSFIQENFFSINKERVISLHPRYYELYFKKQAKREFSTQDYLDLQVWFNLAWIDPSFINKIPQLYSLVNKGRFFTEEEKQVVLAKQIEILEDIIPAYRKSMESAQIEISVSPYYHPILPLLYSTNTAKEANPKAVLPKVKFAYPQDCQAQIQEAVKFYQSKFGVKPAGMWPSEEAVSEHILPFIIESGINWVVADEAILFKSLKKKKRDVKLLYKPYLLKRKEGNLNIVFRDRNLSDLIGFVYYTWKTEVAVQDFMGHLELIHNASSGQDLLVSVAMDGENAWEHYTNDGGDFLNLLYQKLSESKFIKTITVSEYLEKFSPRAEIKRLACGSWIYADFGKWIGSPLKLKAWEELAKAREELENIANGKWQMANGSNLDLARKQIYICEGSDWFWWYGDETNGDFDKLFRSHLVNFYELIGKEPPAYLKRPLTT